MISGARDPFPIEFNRGYLRTLSRFKLARIAREMCLEMRCKIFYSPSKDDLVDWISAECYFTFCESNQQRISSFFRLINQIKYDSSTSRNPSIITRGHRQRVSCHRPSQRNNPPPLPQTFSFITSQKKPPTPKAPSPKQIPSPKAPSPKQIPSNVQAKQLTQFKPSLFYRILEPISRVKEAPASSVQHSVVVELPLTESDIQFLTSTRSDKLSPGIKLFCTHSKGFEKLKVGDDPLCVMFPEKCDLHINGKRTRANLRGRKLHPGTTRAPDVHPFIVIARGVTNRIELFYEADEAFLLVAQKALFTPISMLVDDIIATRSISAAEIKHKLFSNRDEDDLVATVKLSLKCPLGFIRISQPFRSVHCTHAQCFDGTIFFQMNEQMETWQCPVCQSSMDPAKDIFCDEFFLSILENTGPHVESVLLDVDGSWSIPSPLSTSGISPEHNTMVIDLCREQPHEDIVDLTLSDDDTPKSTNQTSAFPCH
ncbi:E3 SUMO-protein ligase pli1, variant 2 [Entomophthora muscae]|uniref:E3 SUMO-protein ligase pli1, variant 2 n=1 Tax=Entomophthora muscae TaxID=34485 RepID=A0ACC2UFT7_9FUNG|nr:E3 SUMO-protein ligase pli1, variant 2 [Entomophthora muscae]